MDVLGSSEEREMKAVARKKTYEKELDAVEKLDKVGGNMNANGDKYKDATVNFWGATVSKKDARLYEKAKKKGDDDDWTWRGFEHILHRLPRKLTRREHASNVIAFQKSLQQDFEIQDQEGNAMTLAAYAANSTFTNGGEARAQSQAIQDEREATDYEETVVVVEDENCSCFSQRKEGLIKTSKRAPSNRWGKMKKIFRC